MAAQAAVDLANGTTPANATAKVNNGTADIASILLTPVAVTAENVKDTVIADGFWTAADVCTGTYAKACTAAGIS